MDYKKPDLSGFCAYRSFHSEWFKRQRSRWGRPKNNVATSTVNSKVKIKANVRELLILEFLSIVKLQKWSGQKRCSTSENIQGQKKGKEKKAPAVNFFWGLSNKTQGVFGAFDQNTVTWFRKKNSI